MAGIRDLPAGRAALLVAFLATASPVAADEPNDPIEPINRTIFALNELLDRMVLEPASIVYGELPQPVRNGVRNFLDNLRAPIVIANNLLQGETDRAGVMMARLMINSTLGLFGLYDLAADLGHPKHDEDFGQTLAVWGMGEGPYVVLPLLGPSNVRDALGRVVDVYAFDVVGQVAPTDVDIARAGADAVDTRQRYTNIVNDLRANSLDRYATVRSAYQQRRAAEIRNGAPLVDDEAYDDIFREEE